MSNVPPKKPLATRQVIEALIPFGTVGDVKLVGIRGYYRDTMGKPGENDRGIYDDAIFVVSPTVFAAFNANTDPSAWRTGIANLKPGVWRYKIGIHGLSKPVARRYEALVQAAKVTVHRDNQGDETGYFGINIHRGGLNSTSSLGCQTIYPLQWGSFIALVKGELKRYGQKDLAYVLALGPVN